MQENQKVALHAKFLMQHLSNLATAVKDIKKKCGRSERLYQNAKQTFDKFRTDRVPKPNIVQQAKEQLLARDDSTVRRAFELWKTAKGLNNIQKFTLEQIEEFSVFLYQESPFVNQYFRKIYYCIELPTLLKDSDKINTATDEAILIQSYLTKHQISKAVTVYRFEPDDYPDRYEVGRTFTENTFLSTTKINDRGNLNALYNSPQERPREIEIRNLRFGADIEDINPRFKVQGEMLVSFGTKFRTVSINPGKTTWKGKEYTIHKIIIENVD